MCQLNPVARDGGRTSSWGERSEREDVIDGQIENYTYSAASRLTQAKLATGKVTLSASYDAAGNLETKTDRGGSLVYIYGVSGHPNRLATLAVTGSDPGIAGGDLSYDAAGRIEIGAGYTVGYDRRGLTATIAHGSDTASLVYAPDGHRYELTVNGETTLYLAGGAFRVVQLSGGVVAYRQAIVAGGRMVAQLVTKSNAGAGFEYFYHDGLGSPVAFASFTGVGMPPGAAYGPYGRGRSPSDWTTLDTGNPLTAYDTRRGYTGGESLAALGVVILGARVYVPALGRWLSPDPAGAGSPYVYAGDNPETDIDPTGEIDWNSVGKIFEAAAIAVVSFYTAGAVDAVYGPVAGGAAGGFVGGFAGSGGNLEDGAIGALGGAAMGYFGDVAFGGANATAGQLAERATVEGVVGGTLSAVVEHGRSGSFESGFLGAFAAALIGGGIEPASTSGEVIAARTAALAVVGGTVAEIGGGSFANGAISAAFQQLFNEAAHAHAKALLLKFEKMRAEAIYGETSGVYPETLKPGESIYNRKNWNSLSYEKLQLAREWIAVVSARNKVVNFVLPTSSELTNSFNAAAWIEAMDSAVDSEALRVPSHVTHFFLRQAGVGTQLPPKTWGILYQEFGPFINVGGGDVHAGSALYIDFYGKP